MKEKGFFSSFLNEDFLWFYFELCIVFPLRSDIVDLENIAGGDKFHIWFFLKMNHGTAESKIDKLNNWLNIFVKQPTMFNYVIKLPIY